MTSSGDLVSLLLEAIEETRRLAQAAHDEVAIKRKVLSEIGWAVTASTRIALPNWFKHANHQRPSSVIRRCAADKGIIALHCQSNELKWLCQLCGPEGQNLDCTYPCDTLRTMALGYGLSVEEETTQ